MQRVDRVLKCGMLILVLAGVVMGCASQGGQVTLIPLTPMVSQLPASQSDYIVQVGDTLNIRFYYHPDPDLRDLIVRPDGKLLLPLIGDIQAAGLTPEQLAEQIAQRYSFTLREPKVAVDVKTAKTGQVYVGGEVQRPGIIQLKPKMNALQAIVEAGGPKNTGNVERVVLLRSAGDNQFGYRELNLTTNSPILLKNRRLPRALARGMRGIEEGMQHMAGTVANAVRVATGRLRPYPGLGVLIKEFYRSIAEDGPPPVDSTAGREVVRVLDRVWEQIGQWRPWSLSASQAAMNATNCSPKAVSDTARSAAVEPSRG